MKLSLRVRSQGDDNLAETVRRRAAIALDRFSLRVTAVTVTLDDLNGPKGGVDKRCTIEASGSFGQRMVESRDTTFNAAIDRAFVTVQRSIVRAIQRQAFRYRHDRNQPRDWPARSRRIL